MTLDQRRAMTNTTLGPDETLTGPEAGAVASSGSKALQPIRMASLAAYGAMAFPLAFVGLPIYLHAPDFYAVTLQIPLATLGSVLLALRLVDAIQDPLIGSLSDRFHTSRATILAIGAVLLGTGFWMLFHPLASAPVLWFALAVFVCTTGFSVVSINFQALGGLWRTTTNERTRITASREAIGLVGLLVAAVTPPILTQIVGPSDAFHWLSLVYLPLLCVTLWLLVRWMRSAPLETPAKRQSGISWLSLLNNRWRGLFFGLVFLNVFASAIPAVLVLFFIRDRLGAETYTGLFLLTYFLSGAISMPLWTAIARKFGKLRAWQFSLAAAILTFCWAALLQQGDIASYALVCALSGLALGADLALPPAILADHIEADGRQQEASKLFSIMAFLSKSALAVATGLALPALGIFGYHPNVVMTPELNFVMSVTYAGLPCIFKLAALGGLLLFEKDLELRPAAA